MKPSRAVSRLLLNVLPALLLLLSALYLVFADLFRLSPYLMLCVSGLPALSGCLLWGAGLRERMVRPGARQGMTAAALLLTLGCLLFYLSGLLAGRPTVFYVLCCASLVPPLLLPAFLMRTFSAAARGADRQQPDTCFLVLLAVGCLGTALVALEPLHHLCYRDGGRSAGPLCYAVYFWFFAGILGTQIYLLTRRFDRKAAPAAAVTAGSAAVYLGIALGVRGLDLVALSYIAPLLLFAFCTLALRADLLPDGHLWPALLQRSTFPVQLMEPDGSIPYGSDAARPIAAAHKAAILNNRYRVSQILDRDTQLSASVIRGGFALHQKDLRDLHTLQDTLEAVSKELAETLDLLSRESELEAKLQRLTEKNAFFAEQEAKIQEKTDRVSVLLRCAAAEDPEPGFLRAVVTRANILVTYIRQLGQLLQEAKGTDRLPAKELTAALESSAQAATAAGLRCRVYNVAQGSFPAGMILSLYDLHERILEDVLTAGLGTLEVRLRNEQSGLRLVLSIPETTLQVFSARANHVVAAARALGGEARITEEDGTVSVFLEFLGG